ncbi:MAG: TrmB family transcriptional regulator [Candidatus Woesearchaeota archaeon]
MLEQTLEQIGLSKYESQIYLALLQIGESTASGVLKHLKIHIGRIYELLESLKEKGLVSEVKKDGVKYFTASSPKKIISYIGSKKTELDKQEKLIESTIKQFEQIQNETKQLPNIEIFTGIEGLKNAFQKEIDRYVSDKQVYVLGVKASTNYNKRLLRFFSSTVDSKRKELNVTTKKINDASFKHAKNNIQRYGEIRYLEMNSTITINLMKDLVILVVSYNPLITIAIESEDVAKGFIFQFESLWKLAEE